MIFSLIIFLFSSMLTLVTSDNTTDYIHQLEKKFSDLQSHTQASEQKQAAVLASVLSKLQTLEEQIQELTSEQPNTTANSNSTISPNRVRRVAFEASTITEQKTSVVYFRQVTSNVGDGYDAHRGIFTAPTAGIYQFWFSAYVSESRYGIAPNILTLDVAGSNYGNCFTSPITAQNIRITTYIKLVHGLHVLPLEAGDTVTVRSRVHVRSQSSFGGVLIA